MGTERDKEQRRAALKRLVRRRLDGGLCVNCGKRGPAAPSKRYPKPRLCDECRALTRSKNRLKVIRWAASGLCRRCGSPAVTKSSCEKHRIESRDRGARKRIEVKRAVMDYYSGGKNRCECCGESELEFLTIDHPNGGGSAHRKELGGGYNFYVSLLRLRPTGLRVLCMNCNMATKGGRVCPHKSSTQLHLLAA